MRALPMLLSFVLVAPLSAQGARQSPRPTRSAAECVGVVPPPGTPLQPEVRVIPPPAIQPGRFPVIAEAGVFISATGTLDSVYITGLPEKVRKDYEKGIRRDYAEPPARPAIHQGCAVGAWYRWGINVPAAR